MKIYLIDYSFPMASEFDPWLSTHYVNKSPEGAKQRFPHITNWAEGSDGGHRSWMGSDEPNNRVWRIIEVTLED